MRERSSGSDSLESSGSTLGGRPASFCSQCEGSSNAGRMNSESTPSRFAARLPRSARRPRCWPCAASRWWRSGRDSSRSARRPCASRVRTPSAAGFRRDTICPGRNAAGRPARSACAGGGSDRRRGRAWSDRPRRYSIPRDSRSSTETKVGSPPMVRRTSPRREIGIDLLAERVEPRPGLVRERPGDRAAPRGSRLTLISKPNSTSANPTAPEIGAAER